MTTLMPTPTINPNVPVVTSAGGTTAAYKDPNSPESILRKTAELQQQAIMDSKFDVNVSAYEKKPKAQGFIDFHQPSTLNRAILLFFHILIVCILVTQKRLTANARLFLTTLAVILLLIVIVYFTR